MDDRQDDDVDKDGLGQPVIIDDDMIPDDKGDGMEEDDVIEEIIVIPSREVWLLQLLMVVEMFDETPEDIILDPLILLRLTELRVPGNMFG